MRHENDVQHKGVDRDSVIRRRAGVRQFGERPRRCRCHHESGGLPEEGSRDRDEECRNGDHSENDEEESAEVGSGKEESEVDVKPGVEADRRTDNGEVREQNSREHPDRPCDARAEGKDGQLAMWPLYGDPAPRDPFNCHRWGYTPTTIQALVMRGPFDPRTVKVLPPQTHGARLDRDMRIEARKG